MPSTDLTWPRSPHHAFKGVDGCRGGWVIATITDGVLDLTLSRDLSPLLHNTTTRVLIDMPIGLPAKERRSCDLKGRALLGHRHSTLFPVATREALYAETHPKCCDINERLQGCRVSKQLWNLVPRIRELDHLMRGNEDLRERVAEGHPELAFMSLCREQQPLPPKRTPEGIQERCSSINTHLPGDITEIVALFLKDARHAANITDCLDAVALALILARGNGAISFIGDGGRDDVGLPMRIAAP